MSPVFNALTLIRNTPKSIYAANIAYVGTRLNFKVARGNRPYLYC